MTALLIHNMAPIMFASLVVFLLLGYPVAFSLAANGLILRLHRHRAWTYSGPIFCKPCRNASTAS